MFFSNFINFHLDNNFKDCKYTDRQKKPATRTVFFLSLINAYILITLISINLKNHSLLIHDAQLTQ
jgi:hypothetical protein